MGGYVQEVLEEAKAFESLPEAEEEKGEKGFALRRRT